RVHDWVGHDFSTHTQVPSPYSDGGRVYSPFPITLIMIIVTGVGVVAFGGKILATRGFHGLFIAPEPWWWYWVLLAGILNLMGFFFQVQGLLLASAAKMSLISASQIVILAVVGVLFFKEPMSILILIGVVLTITGVIFASKEN
ncbi:MAG: EamA family transporter, partial [Thermoguttaceae bacterium]